MHTEASCVLFYFPRDDDTKAVSGNISMIQGTFGVIQGTLCVIQGTFGVIQMMMTILRPFGQLGLWAPSSGVQDVFVSIDPRGGG
jgi:hypothetical protein